MLPYFFLLVMPSILDLTKPGRRNIHLPLFLIALVYVLFICFRFETGSDWRAYTRMYEVMSTMTFTDVLSYTEPGYAALNWLMAKAGIGLVGVNVVVGMIFIFGVIKFAKITPNPWLALVSVTPYLIIVIGMSATRQSAAIGLVFLVLANLNQSNIKKIGLSLLAISFHYSAVIVLFFVLQSMKMTTWLRWSILIVGGLVSFAILKDTSKALEYNQTYAVANIVSPGAIQHAMLNGIPAIIYLLFIKKWNRVYGQVELMKILAIASLLSVAMVFVSSTAVDRLALYLSPIQMLVYATLPVVFRNSIYSVAIIVMHFMILYIWMAYANTAIVFFPYRNLIFL